MCARVPVIFDPERSRVAELDGTGDYIEIPNFVSLNITGNEITVAAWVYFDDVGGPPEIVMAKVFRENQLMDYTFLLMAPRGSGW